MGIVVDPRLNSGDVQQLGGIGQRFTEGLYVICVDSSNNPTPPIRRQSSPATRNCCSGNEWTRCGITAELWRSHESHQSWDGFVLVKLQCCVLKCTFRLQGFWVVYVTAVGKIRFGGRDSDEQTMNKTWRERWTRDDSREIKKNTVPFLMLLERLDVPW
jgi:hypothetical protein